VVSDVPANAYIDDRFVHQTPLVDVPLPPGRHVVRLESSVSGLLLIPKEQSILLRPGESQHVRMELK
jgi:hypothetical protein